MFITVNKKDNKKQTINDMEIGDTFKYRSKYYITTLDKYSEDIVYYDIKENRLRTYYNLTCGFNDFDVELIKVDITITEL